MERDTMPAFALSADQIARFHSDGFFLVERLFDSDEVDRLRTIAP